MQPTTFFSNTENCDVNEKTRAIILKVANETINKWRKKFGNCANEVGGENGVLNDFHKRAISEKT